MTTANQIIIRALKDIQVLSGIETTAPADVAADALDMLQSMVDQFSNFAHLTFNDTEVVFNTVPNQLIYSIGKGGQASASFTGSIAGSILTITNVLSGSITQDMWLSGPGIVSGTQIVQFLTGAGGIAPPGNINNPAVGTYRVNIPASVPSTTITGQYERPLSIYKAFTRVPTSGTGAFIGQAYIDYPIDILTVDEYQSIGIKALIGPWAKKLWYNSGQTQGEVSIFPNPGAGELHLFHHTFFPNFLSGTVDINFPEGYDHLFRWNLAMQLAPMFGKANTAQYQMIVKLAANARRIIKRTNGTPPPQLRIPGNLIFGRSKDAGFFLDGGFS